jgi:hypothetical protein
VFPVNPVDEADREVVPAAKVIVPLPVTVGAKI